MKPNSKVEAIVSWVLAFVVPGALFFGIFFGLGDGTLRWWINSLFISGFSVLLVLGQVFIHRTGTFDILIFGFYRLFESWRNPVEKKYDNATDYHLVMDAKRQKNKPYFLPFLVLATPLLVASLILLLVENSLIG